MSFSVVSCHFMSSRFVSCLVVLDSVSFRNVTLRYVMLPVRYVIYKSYDDNNFLQRPVFFSSNRVNTKCNRKFHERFGYNISILFNLYSVSSVVCSTHVCLIPYLQAVLLCTGW